MVVVAAAASFILLQIPFQVLLISSGIGVLPAVLHLLSGGEDSPEIADVWVVFSWTLIGLLATLMSGGSQSPLVITLALAPMHAVSVGRFRLAIEASVFAALGYLVLLVLSVFDLPGAQIDYLGRFTGAVTLISVIQIGVFALVCGSVLAERRSKNHRMDLWLSTLAETPILILNVDRNRRLRSWIGDLSMLPGVTARQLSHCWLPDLFENVDAFLSKGETGVQPLLRGDAKETCEVGFLHVSDGYRFVITPKRIAPTTEEGLNAAVWVASLGHELKNMLNPVGGYSELLMSEQAGPLNDLYRGFARNIKEGADHLGLLLDDLMTAAKSQAGRLKLHIEPLDALGEAEDAVRLVKWQADASNVSIQVEEHDHELAVSADRNALRQILVNLLTNAIKYSPEGGQIEVVIYEQDERAIFAITDHGEGLPDDEVSKLGQPFFQGENAKTRAGTGLGLSIVKLLAEDMLGAVAFESELGKGTTVRVFLPEATPLSLQADQAAE